MSVLIRSMEMPKSCDGCPVCDYEQGDCLLSNDRSTFDGFDRERNRAPWCPLIEVPTPHGRLIDADALMLRIQEYIDEYGWDVDEHGFHSEKWCAMKETEMAINDAPTVISADKDGET